MENKLEQLKKLKSITLSNEERGLIRSHAARLVMTQVAAPVPSLFFRGVQHGLRMALSAMFFVVFVGGSVSAIADSALPGDPLYSFKLNVNEEVKGAFLKTPEEKVVWQKNRIENRVNEIKTLAASNTLTQAKQEKAKQAISVHVQELSKELTVLSEASPDTALTVTASLEQSLKSSRGSLQARSDDSAPAAASTMMMRSKVSADEIETTPVPESGITAALRTVNEALDQVSKEEVKILTKEINNISNDVTTVNVQGNTSSNTLKTQVETSPTLGTQ
ncbi:hypothetical protein K2Q02_01715 [Patescibacteria group bacterium]|nr:hypothetical protein [Patescibacteria group bacterium]